VRIIHESLSLCWVGLVVVGLNVPQFVNADVELPTKSPDSQIITTAPSSGIKLAPSAALTGGLLGASVGSFFLPKREQPNFVGPVVADRFFRDALQQSTEELRARHAQVSDVGLVMSTAVPLASYGLVALASVGHRSPAQLNRTLIGFQAFFSNMLFTNAVKTMVARERPIGDYGHDSFLSGHASMTFTGAFLILSKASPFAGDQMKGWRYGVGSTALAVATATSALRMSAGRHYLTDVLAGAGSGFVFGYLYPLLVGNGEPEGKRFIPARIDLDPFNRDGTKMSVSFRL
jgi:hypothetical protein